MGQRSDGCIIGEGKHKEKILSRSLSMYKLETAKREGGIIGEGKHEEKIHSRSLSMYKLENAKRSVVSPRSSRG